MSIPSRRPVLFRLRRAHTLWSVAGVLALGALVTVPGRGADPYPVAKGTSRVAEEAPEADSKPQAKSPDKEESLRANPYLAPPGISVEALEKHLEELRAKPKTIRDRREYIQAIAETTQRLVAAKSDDKSGAVALAMFDAMLKLAELGDGAQYDALIEVAKTHQNDARSNVAAEAKLLLLEQKLERMSYDDKEALPRRLDDVRAVFKTQEKLGERHMKSAFAAVKIITSLAGIEDQAAAEACRDLGKQFADSEQLGLSESGRILQNMAKRIELAKYDRASKLASRIELLLKPLEVTGVLVDGTQFDWSKYKGKVVLVDFWATWCGPCVAEIPSLKKHYEQFHARGFEIVGISLDEDIEELKAFLKKEQIPWPTLFSNDKEATGFEHPMATKFNVTAIPTMLLVGKDGRIVATDVQGEELGRQLTKLLGDEEAAGGQPDEKRSQAEEEPAEDSAAEGTPQLVSGKQNRSLVGACEGGDQAFQLFRLNVGPTTRALRLQLSARGNLGIFVLNKTTKMKPALRGHKLRSFLEENALLAGNGETGIVAWSREDDSLDTGTYLVCVAYLHDDPPRLRSGEPVRTVSFEIEARLFDLKTTSILKPGETVDGILDPLQCPFVTYEVLVPEGADCRRLDLLSEGADLDLFIRKDKPALSTSDADASASSLLPTEYLVLHKNSALPLKPGRYYVDVLEQGELAWAVPFKLRWAENAAPPKDVLEIPPFPKPRNPLERALAATVEILCQESGGSGVMISESGYFITNFHVVQEAVEAEVKQRIFVGFAGDPTKPPTLHFEAEVVSTDEKLDLALCRCVAGRYGQPLPEGYRFPCFSVEEKVAARHGDTLWALGFPSTGGSGSRVSPTLTQGVICGFEQRADELHLKTDAQIHSGSSGGAAMTKDFALLGFPTETFSDEEGGGQLGYVRPVWLVPANWWKKAGVRDTAIPPPSPGVSSLGLRGLDKGTPATSSHTRRPIFRSFLPRRAA